MFDVNDLNYNFRQNTFSKLNVIELNKKNINLLNENEIMFIEDSNDGETYILDQKENIYHVNCEYGKELTREDLCKVLKDYSKASYKDLSVYTAINLGLGHALLIKTKIYDEYMKLLKSKITYENQYEDCYNAYCHWLDCALQFLEQEKRSKNMNLIKCPDCNKEFSHRIEACPNCGCPKSEAIKEQEKTNKELKTEKSAKRTNDKKIQNTFKINKNDLMSSKELKEFAFKNIVPILKEELDIDDACIINTNKSKKEVDYYIETSKRVIGLDLFVEVAPSQRSFIYNEEHAKKMSELGYEYAIAQIGVGACDPIRFERRRVFKNDEYYFNYEKLKFFDYDTISNTKISYSLSSNSYSYIYERENENASPYAIAKEIPNFKNDYNDENYNWLFVNLSKLYDIPEDDIKFYSTYMSSLAQAINYRLDVRTLFYNFLNCVDYCKGIFLSDSKEIPKINIIPECYSLLEDNKLINLTKYDRYVFAYYVYYFLTNEETKCNIESVTYMNKCKISLFETKPNYFGFNELCKLNEEKRKINSYENIFKMLQDGIDFVKNNYTQFIQINLEINSSGVSRAVDFAEVNKKIEKLLSDARNKLKYLQDGFDITKDFPKKDIYTSYRKSLNSYIKLLELDYSMNHKLNNKSKGGKYGFFEYRKDSKIRNQQSHETIALVEELSNIFEVKQLSKNSYILIDACKYLVYDLKEKYLSEIKDTPTKYKEFREELCNFYDHVLALPFDNDATDFRKGVLFTITDFIELIEFKEEEKPNLNKIDDREEQLLEDLTIIQEKIYEVQV